MSISTIDTAALIARAALSFTLTLSSLPAILPLRHLLNSAFTRAPRLVGADGPAMPPRFRLVARLLRRTTCDRVEESAEPVANTMNRTKAQVKAREEREARRRERPLRGSSLEKFASRTLHSISILSQYGRFVVHAIAIDSPSCSWITYQSYGARDIGVHAVDERYRSNKRDSNSPSSFLARAYTQTHTYTHAYPLFCYCNTRKQDADLLMMFRLADM